MSIEGINTPASSASGANTKFAAPEATRFSMAQRTVGAMGTNGSSHVLFSAEKAIQEMLKTAGQADQYKIVRVDNAQQTNLVLSSLVVCMPVAEGGLFPFFTLLLAGSGTLPEGRQIQTGSGTILAPAYPEHVFNELYQKAVFETLGAAVADFDGLRSCGATVVPEGFAWSDADAVRRLWVIADAAIKNTLKVKSNELPALNLKHLDPSESLSVSIGFQADDSISLTSEPVRSDLIITTSVIKNAENGQNNSAVLNSGGKVVPHSIARGFMDFAYTRQPNQYQTNPYRPEPPFSARLVVTHLATANVMTLEDQILILLGVSFAVSNNRWFESCRASGNPGAVNPRSIAALNIEGNLRRETDKGGYGTPPDVFSADWNDTALGTFLGEAVGSQVALAIDLPRLGSTSWHTQELLACLTEKGEAQQNAINDVLTATDTLLGSNFQKYYQGGNPFAEGAEAILLGHYTDRAGMVRDLSNLDYLAMANHVGETDPKMLARFTETYFNLNIHEEVRLQDRRDLIKSLFPSAVFTGQAYRGTFSAKFIEAAVKAFDDLGRPFRIGTSPSGTFTSQRAIPGWLAQGTFNASMGAGMFVHGGGNRGNTNGYAAPAWGRQQW